MLDRTADTPLYTNLGQCDQEALDHHVSTLTLKGPQTVLHGGKSNYTASNVTSLLVSPLYARSGQALKVMHAANATAPHPFFQPIPS